MFKEDAIDVIDVVD